MGIGENLKDALDKFLKNPYWKVIYDNNTTHQMTKYHLRRNKEELASGK